MILVSVPGAKVARHSPHSPAASATVACGEKMRLSHPEAGSAAALAAAASGAGACASAVAPEEEAASWAGGAAAAASPVAAAAAEASAAKGASKSPVRSPSRSGVPKIPVMSASSGGPAKSSESRTSDPDSVGTGDSAAAARPKAEAELPGWPPPGLGALAARPSAAEAARVSAPVEAAAGPGLRGGRGKATRPERVSPGSSEEAASGAAAAGGGRAPTSGRTAGPASPGDWRAKAMEAALHEGGAAAAEPRGMAAAM